MTKIELEEKIECKFNPHLWLQRRAFVVKYLLDNAINSVFDFGCGQGSLIQVLINNCEFSKIAGVDIDPDELYKAIKNCSPNAQDFKELRERPLNLQLFLGSIDTEDDRCIGWDAITLIEVIEHLPMDSFSKLPKVLFGTYRPQYIIITTPNAEFNINFPNLNYGTSMATFRHWDHKFEMTRSEFETWSLNNAEKYDYSVSFHGVGYANSTSCPDVGGCTQIAIFKRNSSLETLAESEVKRSFTEELCVDFPFFEKSDCTDSQILDLIVGHVKAMFSKEALWKSNLSEIGFQFTLDEIWNILEIRQVCKTLEKLNQVMLSGKSFKRIDDYRFECLFECEAPEPVHLEEKLEELPFEELRINSSESEFKGWGEATINDSKESGW